MAKLIALVITVTILSFVSGQCLDQPPRIPQTVLETDEAGYYLFNITSTDDSWSFDIETPITPNDFFRSYFNFELHNGTYIFSLNKTLDLEDIYDQLSISLININFKFYCTTLQGQVQNYDYFLRIEEVNEFPPNFIDPPFVRNITEDAVIDTEIIVLSRHAEDKDVNQTTIEIKGFKIHDYQNTQLDGQHKFSMYKTQDGIIRLKAPLDYDTMIEKYYMLNVSVEDRGGLTDFTHITVNVIDVDDQPPEFYYSGCPTSPCSIFYQTSLDFFFTGEITDISPAPIFARDRDSLDYPIEYSIVNGDIEDVMKYFTIDKTTGVVTVLQDLGDLDASSFSLTIKAEEVSENRRSVSTFLWVTVLGQTTESQPTQIVTQIVPLTEDSTLKIAMIVLAVIIFLIIIAFIISMIFMRKKYRKPVSPLELSPAGSEIGTEDEELSITGSDHWPSPIPPGKQEMIVASLPEGRGSLPAIQYVETPDTPTQYHQNITQGTLQRSGQSKKSKKKSKSRENEFQEYDGTREYDDTSLDPEFYIKEKTKIRLSSKMRELDLDPKYWITVDNDY